MWNLSPLPCRFTGFPTYHLCVHTRRVNNQLGILFFFRLSTDYVSGGELFTHLYQRERFAEHQVRIYIAEIILALEHLHKVKLLF